MPDWHGGLRDITSLVARALGIGPYGPADATELRKALRQTTEERRDGCYGDLRAGEQVQYAVRANQDARAAEWPGAPSHAASVHSAANVGDQCDPRPSCRVWDHRAGRAPRGRAVT